MEIEMIEKSFLWLGSKITVTCGINPDTRAYVGRAYFHSVDRTVTIQEDGIFEHHDGIRFLVWVERLPRLGRSRQMQVEVQRWESLSVVE